MKKSPSARTPARPDRRPISVRRWWGNGDIEATVKLTRPQWRRICAGEPVDASTWAWYEGKRERVGFRFNHPERGDLYIGGADGADYDHGTIAEAQVTGAEFPPPLPDATEFTVREGGALERVGITPPETRAEAYDLSPDSLADVQDLLDAADACQPLSWYLDGAFEEAKEAAVAAGQPVAAETDRGDWLDSLPDDAFGQVMTRVHAWLDEEPDWAQEDDYLPPFQNAQGAAFEFFQDWDADDLKALGIVIVEGEHPGSTYYAAELHREIRTANLIAWQCRLPVWFATSA